MTQRTRTETAQDRGSITIGLRQTLRQLTSDPTVATTIALVVLLTGLLLTLTPLAFDRLAAEALDEDLSTASSTDRHIEVRRVSRLGVRASDPFVLVRRAQTDFRESQMPAPIQSLVAQDLFLIDSPQFNTAEFPGDEPQTFPTFLTLRHQGGIEDEIQMVSGRLPQKAEPVVFRGGPDCPHVEVGEDPAAPPESTIEDRNVNGVIDCADVEYPLFEIAVTPTTLAALELEVGDRLVIGPDAADPQFFTVPRIRLDYTLVVEISGVFEANDAEGEFWFDDTALLRPRMRSNADFTDIFATALVAPEAHTELRRDLGLALWDYRFRYILDTDNLTPGDVPELTAELRGMETSFDPIQSALSSGFTMRTGLTDLLSEYLDRKDTAFALLSLAVAGVFVVAAAVTLLLFVLSGSRQGRRTVLLRNRGAAKPQLLATKALQGVLLAIPAAVAAGLVLLPVGGSTPFLAGIGLVTATAILSVAAASPWVFRSLGSLQRDQATVRRASGRRLVVEGLIVALAVLAVTFLRRRGVGEEPGLDLLALLGPALLGVAVGVVTLRVYPMLITPIAWFGAKRKGLVTFVGFKRVQQQATAARLPLTVVLLAAAIAVFTAVIQASIADGQERSTWQTAGAAHRISSFNPGQSLPVIDLGTIGGVEATAEVFGLPDARVQDGSPEAPRLVDVRAVSASEYRKVVAGTHANVTFPTSFTTAEAIRGLGTPDDPIPVIGVGSLPNHEPLTEGMTFAISVNGRQPIVEVRDVRPSFPAVDQTGFTLIVPHGPLEEFVGSELRATDIYIRAPGEIGPELFDHLGGDIPIAVVTSQQTLLEEIRADSFVAAVGLGLQVALATSLLFGAVAAVSSLALMSDARRRDFGYLRTMGLDRSQATRLTLIEQIPAMLVASIVGSLLGVGIAYLLQPAVDVGSFTGPGAGAGLTISTFTIVATAMLLIAVTTIAVAIFAYVDRRQNLSRLLRIGDD